MKFGFKTRNWGIRINYLQQVLDQIAEAGFQGIEFSQRLEYLGCQDVDELCRLLHERGLSLLSLTCGGVLERMAYFGNQRPHYLSIKHGDLPLLPTIAEARFVPAIHPGVFTKVKRTQETLDLIRQHPELKIMFDTAHVTMAGESLSSALRSLIPNIVAVHLKDWTPEYGRSGPRYARGFTDFGTGIVKLEAVLNDLQTLHYDEWVVIETEQFSRDPRDVVFESANWLHQRGLLANPPRVAATPPLPAAPDPSTPPRVTTLEAEVQFREAILEATSHSLDSFYAKLAQAFIGLIPSELVTIWAYAPAQEQIGLLYSSDPELARTNAGGIWDINKALSGIAIDRQAPVTIFDLAQTDPGAVYGYPGRTLEHSELLKRTGIRRMITIPIYNSDHQNYVRLLVNVFASVGPVPTADELHTYGHIVSTAVDAVLDRLISSAVVKVNLAVSECENARQFTDRLIPLIKNQLKCHCVAIFVVNEGGDKLELYSTSGTRWLCAGDEKNFYQRGDKSLTSSVWERNEYFIKSTSLHLRHVKKSEEIPPSHVSRKQYGTLWVPFINAKGKVVGVFRCSYKHLQPSLNSPDMFSDDDAAILDAIGQAAAPHIQMLLDKERRAKATERLTHELLSPIGAIAGAADLMQHTSGVETFFDEDYLGDVRSLCELMKRLVTMVNVNRYASGHLPLHTKLLHLRADIIAPAVKQVKFMLVDRHFSIRQIHYGSFEEIPRIHIDKNQFQQVIFNLLSNAIKHGYDDPSAFQVDIEGEHIGNEFVIRFQNLGPAIRADMREAIFDEGTRTPEAIQRHVTGQGLGLWVVRQIVKAHDGRVEATSLSMPTEFSIFLPDYLASRPPKNHDRNTSKGG